MIPDINPTQICRPIKHWIKIGIVGIFSILLLPYCSPPKLGWWLPVEYTNQTYTQRFLEKFPIGSSESELREFLKDHNYKLYVPGGTQNSDHWAGASFQSNALICARKWWLNWKFEEGLITELEAYYGTICL